MTESEWLSCDDPARMLTWLDGDNPAGIAGASGVSARKLRLWVEACRAAGGGGRRRLDLRNADQLRAAVTIQARPVPGRAALLREIVGNPFRPVAVDRDWLTPDVLGLARAAYEERLQLQHSRHYLDPLRLAVLADALEEAGCDDKDIRDHLRNIGPWYGHVWVQSVPPPHVRGCWALDLILGKE